MTDNMKNIEGIKDEVVGKVKEVWGKAMDNPETQSKGIVQQVEGDVKQAVANGRGHADELKEAASARVEEAQEQLKRQITNAHESVSTSADENIKNAIDEGKRLKDEAAEKAEELRQQAIEENERNREATREQAVEANRHADDLGNRINEVVDNLLNDEE